MPQRLNFKRPHIDIPPGETEAEGIMRYNISIAGKSHDVYFRSADVPLYAGVEPLLILALLPAMRLGADIVPSVPITRDLSDNLIKFMEIFGGWFKEYRQVNILGGRRDPAPPRDNGRVGVFFSGGVDSFYTLIKHQNEITDLIYVQGFDIDLKDQSQRKAVSEMCRNVADNLGKGLVEVETNAKRMLKGYGEWGAHNHGLALGSVAHILSSQFSKIYLASSYSLDALFPWGSHPDTDPLLGSRAITIVHDGCEAKRTEKIATICEHDVVMDHLRICWENVEGSHNCGRCEKCMRTMISLYALGRLERCQTLPGKVDTMAVRNLLYDYEAVRVFARENLSLLEAAHGLRQSPVYTALQTATSRPMWLAKLIKYYQSRKRKLARFVSRIKLFLNRLPTNK